MKYACKSKWNTSAQIKSNNLRFCTLEFIQNMVIRVCLAKFFCHPLDTSRHCDKHLVKLIPRRMMRSISAYNVQTFFMHLIGQQMFDQQRLFKPADVLCSPSIDWDGKKGEKKLNRNLESFVCKNICLSHELHSSISMMWKKMKSRNGMK
ncbi:hypothetical protein Tsp_05456 [Trichinella spiralis]|uniref:hypothetical protein n=1 Tax=Trichinella spiralis TaxID=6334 RepID=UPI0001EFD779|nr:hypothetical protein Tsp_05456 [Trichinella spiralis]